LFLPWDILLACLFRRRPSVRLPLPFRSNAAGTYLSSALAALFSQLHARRWHGATDRCQGAEAIVEAAMWLQ
jgi:hypothetical protein